MAGPEGWAAQPPLILIMGENLQVSDYKPLNRSESQPNHVSPFVVVIRSYSRGFVERTGYFLARSDFAIPRPSSRRDADSLAAAGAVRSPESVRASKASLRRLVYQLAPDRMLTLTYAENMGDYGQAKRDFEKFKKSFAGRYPGSAFVAVPERQQRGAWHFHVALRGYFSIQRLRKWWPHGYARIDYQKRKLRDGVGKIGAYLGKYLSKDLSVLGRAAYSVCNRKVLDKPIITRARLFLGVSNGLPDWVKLESVFKHNALAAYAFNGVYWRLDHVENSSS